MNKLKVGNDAPDFSLTANDGKQYALKDFKGKKIILYFYPQDDTPTCNAEACSFRDNLNQIRSKGAIVIGVSPDGIHSHKKFVAKYNLNFLLLADESKEIIAKYGVWQRKVLFGRKYMGVVRSTFIIDENRKISHIFSNVRIKGHIEKIINALTN